MVCTWRVPFTFDSCNLNTTTNLTHKRHIFFDRTWNEFAFDTISFFRSNYYSEVLRTLCRALWEIDCAHLCVNSNYTTVNCFLII